MARLSRRPQGLAITPRAVQNSGGHRVKLAGEIVDVAKLIEQRRMPVIAHHRDRVELNAKRLTKHRQQVAHNRRRFLIGAKPELPPGNSARDEQTLCFEDGT